MKIYRLVVLGCIPEPGDELLRLVHVVPDVAATFTSDLKRRQEEFHGVRQRSAVGGGNLAVAVGVIEEHFQGAATQELFAPSEALVLIEIAITGKLSQFLSPSPK